jgi:hypothetical protein
MKIRFMGSLFCLFGSAVAFGTVPSYRVQFLGAGWTGFGMNEHGDVCGSMSPDGTALLAGVSHGVE